MSSFTKERILAFLLFAAIFFFGVSLCDASYLACDWVDGIAASEVEVNGTVIPGTVIKDGSNMRLLDLTGYEAKNYHFRARFIGQGGFPSEWSLPFDATKPAAPGGALRIVP